MPSVSREWLTVACGFAVIVGHVYPVWFDFRGGKGAATVVGVVAALELRLLLPLLLSWIVVLLLSGFVGLATMLATVALCRRGAGARTQQPPAVHVLRRGCGVCNLYPSQQHRAHARGKRKSCPAAMAISLASGIEHPPLLVLLADGEVHSGEWLATELKQTRAAVWKGVERLRAHRHRGARPWRGAATGWQSRWSCSMRAASARELAAKRKPHLHSLELLFEVESTNTRLLGSDPPPASTADVCIAELQHAGRGRLGRRWIAPFGGGIAMSLGWTCSDVVRTLPALSLGVGVAVARALSAGRRGGNFPQMAERYLVQGPQAGRCAD